MRVQGGGKKGGKGVSAWPRPSAAPSEGAPSPISPSARKSTSAICAGAPGSQCAADGPAPVRAQSFAAVVLKKDPPPPPFPLLFAVSVGMRRVSPRQFISILLCGQHYCQSAQQAPAALDLQTRSSAAKQCFLVVRIHLHPRQQQQWLLRGGGGGGGTMKDEMG